MHPIIKCAATALLGSILHAGDASAQYYIGPSYLQVPGVAGGAREDHHRDWVRAEAFYWKRRPELREIRGITGVSTGLLFTGSQAPRNGPDMLAISVSKDSPAFQPMMQQCQSGRRIAEVTFAEGSELARHPQERGPRPSDVPDYYEYVLKGVSLACPVVADAPEQAFEVHFDEIVWKNFTPQPKPADIAASAAHLSPAPGSGISKTFVITWFGAVSDSSEDQCPVMNTKPPQADYYALMSPERAARQKAVLAEKGGVDTEHLPYRGPNELNVVMLPGIVADPGFAAPRAHVVSGFDLDGDDGTGAPPKGYRQHQNFTSPEGYRGIDNQLFIVQGCVEGWRRRGFLPMIGNELRRAGSLSILVDISGIDDLENDDDVAVTILYSTDPMRRDGTSKIVLSDYTFGVSEDRQYTQDFVRFSARIVDGTITTSILPTVYMHEGPSGIGWNLHTARMRLTINPDGTLKALLGGYRDWRQYVAAAFFRASDYENTISFQAPGMYNAVRRAADGLQDPVTGEFLGISAAYELEGVPAFIPPSQHRRLIAGGRYAPADPADSSFGTVARQ